MKKIKLFSSIVLFITIAMSCNNQPKQEASDSNKKEDYNKGSFGYDLNFLHQQDSNLLVLQNKDSVAQVIVSPKYQAKVFTSTAEGMNGTSFGWVNYKAFSGPQDAHMNAYGGENRLWLGPEGGKYSLFFQPDKKMVFDNWHTPAAFDTEPWKVLSKANQSVTMQKDMQLQNYAGTMLSLSIKRKITLLDSVAINQALQIAPVDSVKAVAYQTENTITNTGNIDWTTKTGMPCIWLLDMFRPSPSVVIAVPYTDTSDPTSKVATTDYFGQIPPDRIKYNNGVIFFKTDGKSRGKLGLPPTHAKTYEGSYDAQNNVLTILHFDLDPSAKYLNQEWTTTKPSFDGDAVNAYNDGPLEDGSQMGPFYEMESVSPAAMLKSGASLSHMHSVFHFTGSKAALDQIAQKVLGVSVEQIENAFQ